MPDSDQGLFLGERMYAMMLEAPSSEHVLNSSTLLLLFGCFLLWQLEFWVGVLKGLAVMQLKEGIVVFMISCSMFPRG